MLKHFSRAFLLLSWLSACEGSPPQAPGMPGRPPAEGSSEPTQTGDTGVVPSGMQGQPDAATGPEASTPKANDISASRRSNLQWKRYAAFEADLAGALALPQAELCNELGKESCIRGVHLAPLGGHNPFASGLLEPSAEPLATTPTVVERVVLSACSARLALDKAGPRADAKVFGALDLNQAAPPPSDASSRALVSQLYQKLLGRDVDDVELEIVTKLALGEDGRAVAASDFALSACIAIGTSTEFLFF